MSGEKNLWQRFTHWLTHRTCERKDCQKVVRRCDGAANMFRSRGEWLCQDCIKLWHKLKADDEREYRIQKHMRDLKEQHEAALRFEAQHGVYRGVTNA